MNPVSWQRVRGTLAAAVLTWCLLPQSSAAFDVIDPTGALYSNVNDSSHYSEQWLSSYLFDSNLTGVPVGATLSGSEYAKSSTGSAYVSFELDHVYADIGSVYYAQRAGADAASDKISRLSLWTSDSAPFAPGDPGVDPASVIAITNSAGGVWTEYLLTNRVSGQYFLIRIDQTTLKGYPGGSELRLGASLGLPPAVLAINPAATNTYDGNPVALTAQTTGTAPLSYQWQAGVSGSGVFTNLIDGANTTGARTATVTFKNLPVGDLDVKVVVTNPYGTGESATPSLVSVSSSAPIIVTQVTPATLSQSASYPFTLRAELAGSRPMTFQWKHDGVNLTDGGRVSGARSNVLTIASAQATDAGSYQLYVANSQGDLTSEAATVTVVPSLPVIGPSGSIYTEVKDSTHYDANWVSANLFSSDVTGLAPGSTLGGSEFARNGPGFAWISFQVDAIYNVGSIYYAQRASNVGENMQRLSIWASETTGFSPADPGTAAAAVVDLQPSSGVSVWREYFLPANLKGRYYLIKLEQTTLSGNPGANEFRLGQALSTVAITSQPTNQAAYSGNTVRFFVGASGADPLAFQWQARAAGSSTAFTNVLNSGSVSGATASTLVVDNLAVANVEFRVLVSNASSSVTSDTATLTVSTSEPRMLVQPGPAILHQPIGYGLTLSASVEGSQPMSFQWERNGQPLADNGRLTGTRSSALVISALQAADEGTYRLVIHNTYGTVTSAEVALTADNQLGFSDGSAWTFNGGARLDSGTLTLTDGGANQARSAFFNTRVPVDGFALSFVYQDSTIGGADGAALVFQNSPAGPQALGSAGGYLGYGGITPSAALLFNLFGTPGIAFQTGGVVGGYASPSPVNIASGDPIAVTLQYASGMLVITLVDTWTAEAYTNSFALDLPTAVGGSSAYVGFCGADGAVTSLQQISGFTFTPMWNTSPGLVTDIQPPVLTQPRGLSFRLAAAVAGSAPLKYQWKHNGLNLADDTRISGAHSNILSIASALGADAGSYQLYITNAYGWTNTSTAIVTIKDNIELGDGTAWSRNGGAVIAAGVLTLTDAGSQARSAFLNSPVPIDQFVASFTYTDVTSHGADGVAFVLQNSPAGASAVGGAGSDLGYSGITPSAAIELNVYSSAPGGVGFAFATNGLTAKTGGADYTSPAPIDLAGGHPIDLVVRYSGGVLSLTMTDTLDQVSFATNVTLDLPQTVGGHTAYVGFCGATGGSWAQQEISQFTFKVVPSLSIQAARGNSVIISWPAGINGLALQQSASLAAGSWQAVTETPVVVDGQNQVTVSAVSTGFFRLVAQ